MPGLYAFYFFHSFFSSIMLAREISAIQKSFSVLLKKQCEEMSNSELNN